MGEFLVEFVVPGCVTRAIFDTKRKAENARRKIEKEMGKGKFRNDLDIVTIKASSGTISVRASELSSVCTVDLAVWDEFNERRPMPKAPENG